MANKLRVIGMLVGDIHRQSEMHIKYGIFFEELAKQCELVDIYDASLKGLDRWVNAAQTFELDRKKWKEHFFKNVPAFELRSKNAVNYLQKRRGEYDVALQLGAMFDATRLPGNGAKLAPTVLYTDYTTALTAQRPNAGRMAFRTGELSTWKARENMAYHHAAHIFVRAGFVRTSLVGDYGILDHKITRIGAGVNFNQLPEISAQREAEKNAPTVLFIGKDFHRKGGDLMLEAFAKAREKHPNARLRMVTRGPVPADLPLAGVEVLQPTWDREMIERLYREADLFVLPSRLETWGDVLLEAMAYGLPCIGVRGEAMEEIIANDETGCIIPPNNVNALAHALDEQLSRPAKMRVWGQAARSRVEKLFTWKGVVENLVKVLTTVVKSPQAISQ